jgi:cation transport ATPase
VVFDKTGTLTQGGEPAITDVEIYPDQEAEDVAKHTTALAALRAVEESSSHPVARAIASYCASKSTTRLQAEDLHELPGKGMKAVFRNVGPDKESFEMIIGNEALMEDFSVVLSPKVVSSLEKWKTEAKSIALAATRAIVSPATEAESGWTVAAILSISDPIRPEAFAIVKALQNRGTMVYMLSGDNATTATAVGTQLGIPAAQIIAGVLPTQKAAQISYLQKTLQTRGGRRAVVAMVGDGINDSPALTVADVGIAVGSGSDVAISSASFVLIGSDLRAVVTLLDLSRAVFRRIKFNFGWALIYNVLAIPVAAGALYPIVSRGQHVRLDPVWASLAMALSSISVVLSSLALRSGWPIIGFKPTKVQ